MTQHEARGAVPEPAAKKSPATATKVGAIALTALVLGSGLNAQAAFAEGGGGGVPGSGHGNSGAWDLYNMQYDEMNAGTTTPSQGVMASSTEWFISNYGGPGAGDTSTGTGAQDQIRAACTIALERAEARGGNQGKSRVVGIMWAGSQVSPWASNSSASASFFQERWDQGVVGAGFPGVYTESGPFMQQHWPEALAGGGETPSAVCIALNQNEPPQSYPLDVTTDKNANFTMSGGTQPVSDTIHVSNGGSAIAETLEAQVILHWDGVEGNARTVAKTQQIANQGDTQSEDFTPADFGWSSWPQGTFWFDVIVPQQGSMSNAVNTPDRDPRETWKLNPVKPNKELWDAGMTRKLTDQDVLASGMMHNAVITAQPNGYASAMTITDAIQTDKVWIGAKDKDVASAAYILDPEGKKVAGAKIDLARTAGKVTVSGTVTAIPDKFQNRNYTLVVPTYVQPTKADYSIVDKSHVCYTDTGKDCIDGPTEKTRKVTPTPDKVWVLDENGALTARDPDWTNQAGADEKVFLQGDAVSAVVNGKIKGKMPSNLDNYQIIDDWTKAAKYVNFSDPKKVNVYYETSPGSGKFDKVTDQFDIKVSGTKTTATAKAGFLSKTKNLSADRAVKLIISGEFRTDYDTQGETVVLHNNGSEIWNNEEVPTNEPPVYTWTPDPNKQVLGSAEENGDHAHDNINGMHVWPGQKLEYSLGIDLRIPKDTARGVKSLAVQDVFDAKFTPDKSSVEFWDSRDPKNPKPLPRSAYKLTWDDAGNSWTATFTDAWIKDNLGPNSQWLTQGWLTARFTGTVDKDAAPGSKVKNQGFEIINGAKTATEIPEVNIPNPKPDKEDLNTDLIDIDKKTVVKGDTILYRLTLDAMPSTDKLAYKVHKLGMTDDFDEEFLSLDAKDIRVTNKATGADVTGKFNIQVKDGVAYVFAKQVDSENSDGDLIKGDPQPKDLAKYATAGIDPMKTPIIDQQLMGHQYFITLPTKVIKDQDGYVIKNQAVQNIENSNQVTKIVSNPLKKINPDKDVVVKAGGKDSIDGTEVKLNSEFNYLLNSSKIPADRAYTASQWSITDAFDRVHDQYTGIWAVYANTDVYEDEKLVFKKGDVIQSSESKDANYFAATFDEASYTFGIEALPAYLDLVNTRGDLEQQFSVYTKMLRVAPAEQVVNVFDESYNEVVRKSDKVITRTPESPAIDIEKYTLDEGMKKGDRDTLEQAYGLNVTELKDGVKVGFRITNTGDVPLQNVSFGDLTINDTQGQVEDISCDLPEVGLASPSKLSTLAVGESIDCTGILLGLAEGDIHSDNATVTAESVYTKKKVSDEDPWHAKAPAKPLPEQVAEQLATTGGAGIAGLIGSAVALLGGGATLAFFAARRNRAHTLQNAGNENTHES